MSSFTEYVLATTFKIGKAISFELMRSLYENPLAIAEGADDAPRISRRAIQPGGSEIDGAFINATVAPTTPGYYEYSDFDLSTAKTLPYVSIIRINSDVTLTAAVDIDTCDNTTEQALAEMLGCTIGRVGANSGGSSQGGGGGGHLASGGKGSGVPAGGVGYGTGALNRRWLDFRMIGGMGGAASTQAGGGGVAVIIINGNLTMTGGGKFRANGMAGSGNAAGGGGAGGTLIVIVTGTITDGEFEAKGGNGMQDISGTNSSGGGGAGGYVALIANAYLGIQTITVTGGTPGNSGSAPDGVAGGTGVSEKLTIAEAGINGLLLR